ncbi:MAG: hypothetical protein Q8N53_11415 [Longimicrobiales bacterium]|nr:hypothetical protein [Longimicrobiales bacterium]
MSSAEQAPGAPPGPTGSGTLRAVARGVAGSLAAAAILLTVWEGLENRRHNGLSVQPRIDGASVVSERAVAPDVPVLERRTRANTAQPSACEGVGTVGSS